LRGTGGREQDLRKKRGIPGWKEYSGRKLQRRFVLIKLRVAACLIFG
jgi:hypothetical protein